MEFKPPWDFDYHVSWATFWRRFSLRGKSETPTTHDLFTMLHYWNCFPGASEIYQNKGITERDCLSWINVRANRAIEYLKLEAENEGLNSLVIHQMHEVVKTCGQGGRVKPFDDEETQSYSCKTMDFLRNVNLYFKKKPTEAQAKTIQRGMDELFRLEVRLRSRPESSNATAKVATTDTNHTIAVGGEAMSENAQKIEHPQRTIHLHGQMEVMLDGTIAFGPLTIPRFVKAMRGVGGFIMMDTGGTNGLPPASDPMTITRAKLAISNVRVLRERLGELSTGDCKRPIVKSLLVTERSLQKIIDGPQQWESFIARYGKEGTTATYVFKWMTDAQANECKKLLNDAADDLEVMYQTASEPPPNTNQPDPFEFVSRKSILYGVGIEGQSISEGHLSKLIKDGPIKGITGKGGKVNLESFLDYFVKANGLKEDDQKAIEVQIIIHERDKMKNNLR